MLIRNFQDLKGNEFVFIKFCSNSFARNALYPFTDQLPSGIYKVMCNDSKNCYVVINNLRLYLFGISGWHYSSTLISNIYVPNKLIQTLFDQN